MNKQQTINICFASDDKYIPYLTVALTSILSNKSANEELCIYLLTTGINRQNRALLAQLHDIFSFTLNYIIVDTSKFTHLPIGAEHFYISHATYYRFLLASLLPNNIDQVLYLDCDLIVTSSLYQLYTTNLQNNYIAGVIDVEFTRNSERLGLKKYCNAGVLLVNLQKWRQEYIEDKLFNYMYDNLSIIKVGDQDVLNVVLQDGIMYLDETWNMHYLDNQHFGQSKLAQAPNIVHYTGCMKPWVFYNQHQFAYLYHDYFALSPLKKQSMYFKLRGIYQFLVIVLRKVFQKYSKVYEHAKNLH